MSEIPFSLNAFLPKKDLGIKIEIEEELTPVMERISKIIPPIFCGIFSLVPLRKQEEELCFLTQGQIVP